MSTNGIFDPKSITEFNKGSQWKQRLYTNVSTNSTYINIGMYKCIASTSQTFSSSLPV